MSGTIASIQRALQTKGFDPGEADGVWGRKTISALRAFQAANNLVVDGVFGPNTSKALLGGGPSAPPSQPIVWFDEARRQFGTRETPGPASNPVLLEWASDLGIPYHSDDIPWCGLFVAHCIGSTLTEEVLPRQPLLARAWKTCGTPTTPRLGAIMVFWRGSKEGSSLGHVAFYAGEDDSAYHVLGGNQSDQVSLARVAKNRLLDTRWPKTAASIVSAPVKVAAGTSALSTKEA